MAEVNRKPWVEDEIQAVVDAGFAERFLNTDKEPAIRLTPKGARHYSDEALTKALESCRAGKHQPVRSWARVCACGEKPTR